MSTILRLEQLCRKYTRGRQPVVAVDNVSLEMQQGDFACIMGRSGSGKTTLAGMVAGLITPTSGSVVFRGQNFASYNDNQLAAIRNTQIGYIPQGSSLLPYLTAVDNVRLPYFLGNRSGPDTSASKAMDLLEKAGIAHLASAYPATMSGGESRRVAMVRALMLDPVLLIADEPTSDLDLETTQNIANYMRALNHEGMSLLVVTHDAEIAAVGTSLYTMAAGKITQTKSA